MTNETILEEKYELEQKIAHLCNEFVEGRNIHIEHIYVNYGSCNKGWFPDWIINIDIVINSIMEIPCGDSPSDSERLYHLFGSAVEEE